jgi:arginine decarboxylase
MVQILKDVSLKNFQESYHDALQLKEEAISLFNLGYLDLEGRAIAENAVLGDLRPHPADRQHARLRARRAAGLERALADTYYCNFSVFQSAPDHWAVKQLFPIDADPPARRTADAARDAGGPHLRQRRQGRQVHRPARRQERARGAPITPGKPYYLGMFLVGAYQEILGDLHNLFGDTNAIHISMDEQHGYRIERVIEGRLGYRGAELRAVRQAGPHPSHAQPPRAGRARGQGQHARVGVVAAALRRRPCGLHVSRRRRPRSFRRGSSGDSAAECDRQCPGCG